MDGDEAVVDQEMTPELDAAADAEFEAAFNTKRSNLLGLEGTTNESAAAAAPKAEEVIDDQGSTQEVAAQAATAAETTDQAQAAAAAPAAVTPAPAAPAVTKEAMDAISAQVAALHEELKQTRDKTAGSIGSLKQTLDAVKAQAQKGIRPTVKQLARLEGEFPELAALLTQDLADAFGEVEAAPAAAAAPEAVVTEEASGAAAPGAEPVDPLADPRVVKVLREKEMDIVTLKHPDWRQLQKTPEFDEWRNSLPAAAKNLLASTWESKVLTDAFTDFKVWKGKREAAATAMKERGKNLEHAIQPTSGQPTGKSVQDDDAAFMSGFNKARGNR